MEIFADNIKYTVLRKMKIELNRFQTISFIDVNVEPFRLAIRTR